MDNILIGVICSNKVIDGKVFNCVSKNALKFLSNKCNYLIITLYDDNDNIYDNILNLFDGFIIYGGNDIFNYHNQIIDFALNNNKPLMGICMGMQAIGLKANNENDGDLIKVCNHNSTIHNINIIDGSFLYDLYGNNLMVNSRHNYALSHIDSPYLIGATSDDNLIEEIEYIDNEHFILGFLFHIEDMDNSDKIYNCFIKKCFERKKNLIK